MRGAISKPCGPMRRCLAAIAAPPLVASAMLLAAPIVLGSADSALAQTCTDQRRACERGCERRYARRSQELACFEYTCERQYNTCVAGSGGVVIVPLPLVIRDHHRRKDHKGGPYPGKEPPPGMPPGNQPPPAAPPPAAPPPPNPGAGGGGTNPKPGDGKPQSQQLRLQRDGTSNPRNTVRPSGVNSVRQSVDNRVRPSGVNSVRPGADNRVRPSGGNSIRPSGGNTPSDGNNAQQRSSGSSGGSGGSRR